MAMPESPVWLRSKKRYKEAEEAVAWLKLPPTPIIVSEKVEMELKQMNKSEDNAPQKSIYFTRPVIMPLIIGLTLLVLQQISGIDSIIFFTVEIFRASGKFDKTHFIFPISLFSLHCCFFVGSSINSHLATIIIGLVQLISNIASLFVIDKSGRKPLLIISAIIMCLSMGSMGTAFYLKQQNITSFG